MFTGPDSLWTETHTRELNMNNAPTTKPNNNDFDCIYIMFNDIGNILTVFEL
jgi:hypothetical protein